MLVTKENVKSMLGNICETEQDGTEVIILEDTGDRVMAVPLAKFCELFQGTELTHSALLQRDNEKGYGYSRFIEKWHNEGLI
jgi:hypothetical protein